MGKIMTVIGTRPEATKLVSTIKALENSKHDSFVVHTGQHKELANEIFETFNIKPKYSFNMKKKRTLDYILTESIKNISKIIKKESPDLIIVLGDTTSVLAGALAGFYNKVKVMHVEAGVRTPSVKTPFPEEANRRLVTRIADYHICQSSEHLYNLKHEGYKGIVSGNTGADALKLLKINKRKKNQILITIHRRENWDKIKDICTPLKKLAEQYTDYTFIVSCHPNPVVKNAVKEYLKGSNIIIRDAMPYKEFVETLAQSKLVVTDSGSVPQEASVFKTPAVITRDVAENPLILELNLAVLVGTSSHKIFFTIKRLLDNKTDYERMKKAKPPYVYGNAGKLIKKHIDKVLK